MNRFGSGANLALCARNADALNLIAEEARRVYRVEVYTATFDVAEDEGVRQFADSVQAISLELI